VVGESTALPDGLSSEPDADLVPEGGAGALPSEGATVVLEVVVVVLEGFESPAANATEGASARAVISNGFRIWSFDMKSLPSLDERFG
jgi:hypothetical protein